MDDLSKLATRQILAGTESVGRTSILRAALNDPLILSGGLHHFPAFPDAQRYVFSTYTSFPAWQPHGRERVPVFRGRDDDAIYVLVVERTPHIRDPLGTHTSNLHDISKNPFPPLIIHFAYVLELHFSTRAKSRKPRSASTRADQREHDFAVRRLCRGLRPVMTAAVEPRRRLRRLVSSICESSHLSAASQCGTACGCVPSAVALRQRIQQRDVCQGRNEFWQLTILCTLTMWALFTP